jgi:hypothetical protein
MAEYALLRRSSASRMQEAETSEPSGMIPTEFDSYIKAEMAKWRDLIGGGIPKI